MKSAGIKMSVLMGLSMSFCLSLAGNLSSGRFTLPGFLVSFAVSFAISLAIGLLVPMGRVTGALDRRLGLRPGALPARALNALVSDLVYTPAITLVMVFLAWKRATGSGAQIPFLPMLLRSLGLTLVVGYALAFILMPLFLKRVMKK